MRFSVSCGGVDRGDGGFVRGGVIFEEGIGQEKENSLSLFLKLKLKGSDD